MLAITCSKGNPLSVLVGMWLAATAMENSMNIPQNIKNIVGFSRSVVSDSLWPMDCSTPGFPVHHQLPELAQTHVYQVSDPIQHLILCHPLLLPPLIFPSIKAFPVSQFFASDDQNIGTSASASVLPVNIQDWLPLQLTGLISLQSKGLSRVFPTPHSKASILQHSAFFIVPTLTSIHDY